jgi:photosynthetic reaction center cytochrome c subunit
MIKDYPNLAKLAKAEPEAAPAEDTTDDMSDAAADMTTGGDQ